MADLDTSPKFRTYEEVWNFCLSQCRDFKVGCATQCPIRKKLEIPPFSKSYLGKMKGEVKKGVGGKM